MFLIYLALPQIGSNLVGPVPGPGHQLRAAADPRGGDGRHDRARPQLRRLHDRDLPRRHPVGGHGQGEAADALGMRYVAKMRRVVLPQAMRVIIPPTGNEFIAMMKDTALVSFLGVAAASAEMFRAASSSARPTSRTSRPTCWCRCSTGADGGVHDVPEPAGGQDVDRVRARRRAAAGDRPGARARRRCGMTGDDVLVRVSGLTKTYGRHEVAARHRPRAPPRRGDRHLRPVRVGQVHPPAVRELPRGPHRGHDRDRRRAAVRRLSGPAGSGSRSAGSGCTPGWSSSSSTCSPTSPPSRT